MGNDSLDLAAGKLLCEGAADGARSDDGVALQQKGKDGCTVQTE
jgi:hypothetical protein